MAAWVKIEPSDAVPIWKQIEDGVRRLVASGQSPPGTAIPSVRELAKELRVNPATVSKAYGRLTAAGVLVVRRGEGTFIAERTARELAADRSRILADGARSYAEVAHSVEAGLAETVTELEREFLSLKTQESEDRS